MSTQPRPPATTKGVTTRIIDSHLHVWASSTEAAQRFPYTGPNPPDALQDVASTDELVAVMNAHGVQGALIVQPINHKFDHSYVIQAMQRYPTRFKGMLLHDPSLTDDDEAVSRLEDLALQGFVGVRFNPYLWPKNKDDWSPMSQGSGLAVYQRCAQLNMPVGIMCFQGLQLHYEDILQLLQASPQTVMILDHFAFTSIPKEEEDGEDDVVFQKLLDLAQYPQVLVKISALFRLGDASPYERVRHKRFLPLLQAFGADRLMYGSDFPYVLEHEPEQYGGMIQLVSSWIPNAQDKIMIMGDTAEKAFGPWGVGAAAVSSES